MLRKSRLDFEPEHTMRHTAAHNSALRIIPRLPRRPQTQESWEDNKPAASTTGTPSMPTGLSSSIPRAAGTAVGSPPKMPAMRQR